MAKVSMKDLIDLNTLLSNSLSACESLRGHWEAIKWHSPDKDNMEFLATITHFQKEEIDRLFTLLLGKSGV